MLLWCPHGVVRHTCSYRSALLNSERVASTLRVTWRSKMAAGAPATTSALQASSGERKERQRSTSSRYIYFFHSPTRESHHFQSHKHPNCKYHWNVVFLLGTLPPQIDRVPLLRAKGEWSNRWHPAASATFLSPTRSRTEIGCHLVKRNVFFFHL